MQSIVEDSRITKQYEEQMEAKASRYLKRYRPYIEMLESRSLISKIRAISPYDVYALGRTLEQWEEYHKMVEDDGTLAQLGRIPNVAFDVITVAYGTAPISAIASVQPIDEERGTVYFKNVIAQTTRGNITAPAMIAAADRAPAAFPEGYAGDQLTENIGPTVGGTTAYSGTLTQFPLRPFKTEVRVTLAGAPPTSILIRDVDGNGQLVGYQSYGTVNYATGAITVNIPDPLASNAPIYVTYATDFEGDTDIPKIIMRLETKSVNARVFALKDTVGLEQSYALRRRFGLIAEDEIATDLVSSINSEITRTLIRLLDTNTMGSTTWPKAPPTGVSSFEHYQTFKLSLADAESVLLGNAGRGTISSMIAGREVAAVIQTLPGFVKLSDGSTIGSHIFGTLDGMTIIRVPYAYDLDPKRVICLYKGLSPFEAPVVYAPYMPLVVTTALPTGLNPLLNQKAAAVWAATDALVPAFSTRLDMSVT